MLEKAFKSEIEREEIIEFLNFIDKIKEADKLIQVFLSDYNTPQST